MNTIEKRKLEGVISAELAKAKEAYKARRERERNELVTKFETNQTPQVKQQLSKLVTVRDTYDRNVKELEDKLDKLHKQYAKDKQVIADEIEKQGFCLSACYRGESPNVSVKFTTEYTGRYYGQAVRKYTIPELVKFEKETNEQLAKLDEYDTECTVSVWATGDDMAKMLKDFYKGLGSIVA